MPPPKTRNRYTCHGLCTGCSRRQPRAVKWLKRTQVGMLCEACVGELAIVKANLKVLRAAKPVDRSPGIRVVEVVI